MTAGYWSILLFAGGLLLLVLEVFLPAAGILGFVGAGGIVAGIVFCFTISPALGTLAMAFSVASIPFFWMLFVKMYPRTYVGRRTLLPKVITQRVPLPVQLGQTGTTVSDMKPMGVVEFNGSKVEALSETGLMEAGTKVIVVSLDHRRPVVRAI